MKRHDIKDCSECGWSWFERGKWVCNRIRNTVPAQGIHPDCPLPDAASSPWLPIETAPRDGTDVLAFSTGGFAIATFHDCWRELWSYRRITPTHWQPLPEGPEA